MEWTPWIAAFGSAAPPVGAAIWYLLQRSDKNKETQEARALSFDERRESELNKERERISSQRDAAMADLRMEIDRCHAEINGFRALVKEKNVERFMAWDRARAWHQKAWDMRNEAAYARQLVDSMLRTSGQSPHVWPSGDLMLPLFDNIIISDLSRDEK